MLTKNKHVVFCDGGLSNRLNTLIFALILKEKYKHEWELSWPVNNWCRARLASLFSIDIPVNENELIYYKEKEDAFCLVMHENQCGFIDANINFQSNQHSYADYEKLLENEKPTLYYHNLIPQFATFADMQSGLSHLSIHKDIHAKASGFCLRNQINDSVFGLHIRKTDFGSTVDDNELFNVVKDSANRFFVCSDDAEVNARFSKLPNCCVYKKTHFPSKMLGEKGWNDHTIDDQGREFFFNIDRSEASIVEALIDLLILSKTTHVATSHSTFLRMSMIFKATNFFKFDEAI
ncbi:MAG: hypothetical protein ACOVN3_13140 [Limnohabitans sp.]